MNLEKTIKSLEGRGFRVSHFADAAQAAEHIVAGVRGRSVGIGGSKTVEALGLYEKLAEQNTVYWHWKTPGRDTLKAAALADVYVSSANAISEDGEILNIDGTGNRVAGMLFGHEKVYIVAGTNKIAPDYDAALFRARNTAAVQTAPASARRRHVRPTAPATTAAAPSASAGPSRSCGPPWAAWRPRSCSSTATSA